MRDSRRTLVSYLEDISLFVIGVTLILFPLIFSSATTDAFIIPKQMLLLTSVTISLLLVGIMMILDGRMRIRKSPFDLPVFLFTGIMFFSAIFSNNTYDAYTTFVPFLFCALLYFAICNIVRKESALLFMLSSLTIGAVLSSLFTIFTYFGIYILPFSYTHITTFSFFGSTLDQTLYFAIVLCLTGYFFFTLLRTMVNQNRRAQHDTNNSISILFSIGFFIIALAFGLSLSILFTKEKPLILPFETGFRIAFAEISQDNGRVFRSFLLGSGLGTFITDFTRFRPVAFNLNSDLWSFAFFRSSSFVLELLTTTGVLGILAYIFLMYKVVKERNYFAPLLVLFLISIFLPFSFILQALLFILLGLFAVIQTQAHLEKYPELEFHFVALKHGLFTVTPEGETVRQNDSQRRYTKALPILFFLLLLVLMVFPYYLALRYTLSDLAFQNSLIASTQNNGLQAYKKEIEAIGIFPYRDIYYRAFSQINLSLANALALSARTATLSAQQQQNILTLTQQSIDAGKSAITAAPYTAFNWNNLSSVYRSLIGFGQNADKFAIASNQQAIALDPNNPQQYINLGGIYYQLGMWDDAIRQFQIAVNLKPDYANGYYNLGHAYESKGDLNASLSNFETVSQYVGNDKQSLDKINSEIQTVKDSMNKQAKSTLTPTPEPPATQSLDINKPSTQLPPQSQKVKIPGPTISPIPTVSQAATPTPALSPTL